METLPSLQGTFVSLCGQGVLIRGSAGVGKSSLALALVDRGHQLVADDGPRFERRNASILGHCPPGFQGKLLVTGLGTLDLHRFYGASAVADKAPLSLVVILDPKLTLTSGDELLNGKRDQLSVLGIAVPQWHLAGHDISQLALMVEIEIQKQNLCHPDSMQNQSVTE